MYRSILLAGVLFASSTAHSAPPEIAYATAGSRGDTIYFVNSTGMGLTKLYQGKSTSRAGAPIDSIALRSHSDGGGEVAFIESERALKIIKHDNNGQPDPNGAYSVAVPDPQCILHDLDYLENGTLIIATSCNLLELAPGERTATPHPVIDSPVVQSLTAIGDSLLYVESRGKQGDLKRLDGATITPVKESLSSPFFFVDAAPRGASPATAFLSDKYTFQTVGLTSPYPVQGGCTTGSQGGLVEVSPNGSEMLYLYRNQMFVHASNCQGRTPSRLARGVRSFAWRTH